MLSKDLIGLFFKNTANIASSLTTKHAKTVKGFSNQEQLLVSLMMFFSLFQSVISQSSTPTPSSILSNNDRDALIKVGIIMGSVFGGGILIAACCAWCMNGFKCCSSHRRYDNDAYVEVGSDQQAIDAYQLPELNLKVDPL